MTECATSISNVMLYYGDEETGELGAHFSFNFNLLGTFTSAGAIVESVLYWLDNMPMSYTANWLVIQKIFVGFHSFNFIKIEYR